MSTTALSTATCAIVDVVIANEQHFDDHIDDKDVLANPPNSSGGENGSDENVGLAAPTANPNDEDSTVEPIKRPR
jgi:hypothetical protein